MLKLGDLFILQLLYQNYDEFKLDFIIAFNKYFGKAKNKNQIKEILIKYLYDVKFTKDELKQVIAIRESRSDDYELEQNEREWEEYNKENNINKRYIK